MVEHVGEALRDYAPAEDRWLALVSEPVVDPERRIIDPHHHLWDHPYLGTYLLADWRKDMASGHNVEQTVYIECGNAYRTTGPEELRPVGEIEYAVKAAAETAKEPTRIGAVVGFADMTLGARVDDVLDAHHAAGAGLFRGVRHSAIWHGNPDGLAELPPPGLLTLPSFREGVSRVGRKGFSFEAWCFHTQLAEMDALVRAVPETTFIVNHYSGPLGMGDYRGRTADAFREWKPAIAALARYPNVVVKLGGLAMTLNGFEWHKRPKPPTSDELAQCQRPYALHVIDRFGPERCMFESNFPVDKHATSYRVLWNAFKKMASGFSPDETDGLFYRTAKRVYRLS